MKFFFIFILIYFVNNKILCLEGEEKENYLKTFGVKIGGAFPIQSYGFWEIYNNDINEINKQIPPRGIAGIFFKLEDKSDFRFGLNTDYFIYNIFDDFKENIQTINGIVTKSINESIKIENLPIYLSGEYIPYKSQFRSFIGFGIGLAYNRIKWIESVYPKIDGDKRIGGIIFDENYISFLSKFNCGIELGFDKDRKYKFLNSLFLEFYTIYLANYQKFFVRFKEQKEKINSSFDESYSIIPIVFGISIGCSFNIVGK